MYDEYICCSVLNSSIDAIHKMWHATVRCLAQTTRLQLGWDL